MDIIKGRRKQLLINKKTLNFVILLLLWQGLYNLKICLFRVMSCYWGFFFKRVIFQLANAGHPVPKVSGAEFLQSKLFSAKMAFIKISDSDRTTQISNAREGKAKS